MRPFFTCYVYGLHGCYPAKMTTRQIRHHLWLQVNRRAQRWPEYLAVEKRHGVDLLPDEARSWAHGYAQVHKMNFEDAWRVSQGWRPSARRPGHLWPYERVLRFYLPLKRLRRFLFALRELAEETVMKAPPPLLSLFRIREP